MDPLDQHVTCPGCGRVFSAPNVFPITLTIEPNGGDGVAIVIRLDTLVQRRRDVLHECPTGGRRGDGTLVPAWPPHAPPAGEASLRLDPPETRL